MKLPDRLFNEIMNYAKVNGSLEVFRSWRDKMLEQGREVPERRMNYETLSDNDKALDATIAFEVISDYLIWYENHVKQQPLPY